MKRRFKNPASKTAPVIVKALRDAIKELDLKQADVARKIGVSGQWMSKKLSGQTPIFLDEFILICEAIGVHPTKLWPDEDYIERVKDLRMVDLLGDIVSHKIKEMFKPTAGGSP